MDVTAVQGPATGIEADVLVVPVLEDDTVQRQPLRDLDRALSGQVAAAIASGEVDGKPGQASLWPTPGLTAGRVLLVGAGPRAGFDAHGARIAAGTAARRVMGSAQTVALVARSEQHAEAMVEGFLVGAYEPDLYRSKRSPMRVERVLVLGSVEAAKTGGVLAEATNLCRTLVAEPPNELTPTALAERARTALEPLGVKVDVMTGADLGGFGGLLGVARGSDEPPVLISMSWEPSRSKRAPVLGLVGKGVTFDSGGLSLKTNDGMQTMKGDMGGAAAVIAAMQAIARLKVPLRVKAAVPATENMPSGKAMRVGDVLRAWSGKTIEVLNTDAEGRLILADGLAWLAAQGVTHLADAATLTGAVEVALGRVATGVMGRPDRWVDRVVAASRRAGERAWPLPLYPEYRELIRSEIADVKNTGGRPAGSITAAWFLAEFVPEDMPWAHLDIAGTSWDERKPHRAAGPTGAGVRAFVRLAQDMAEKG